MKSTIAFLLVALPITIVCLLAAYLFGWRPIVYSLGFSAFAVMLVVAIERGITLAEDGDN